ncbi:hypothetical protein [Streptomyces fildesensis]|uniref:hypothetical protein n=1 Tax=Streptomyces fildesensis TaxID=375757 RepID=UPI0018DEF7EB|nr:hypothetical protein [Streptomyces fildesensis]
MSVPDHAQVARTALRELSEQVEDAETWEQVAQLIAAYFDPKGGALAEATSVLWAVSRHFESRVQAYHEDEPAYALWHRLVAAAEALGDITTEVSTTCQFLRTPVPGPPEPTALQQAAYATSPAHTDPMPPDRYGPPAVPQNAVRSSSATGR